MTPAQPIASAIPQAAPQTSPAVPQQQAAPKTANVPTLPEEGKESLNLHRAFSRLNESLTNLADESGVPRSATIPHQDGQSMDQHIADVGRVLSTVGGMTANLLTVSHSRYGADGGSTVAHPAQKLRDTLIPKDDPNAIKAISACRSFVSKAESLIGEDDPAVKLATSQLNLVGKNNGSGMTALDLIVALINIPGPVIQAVARRHNDTKSEGPAHPKLKPPRQS